MYILSFGLFPTSKTNGCFSKSPKWVTHCLNRAHQQTSRVEQVNNIYTHLLRYYINHGPRTTIRLLLDFNGSWRRSSPCRSSSPSLSEIMMYSRVFDPQLFKHSLKLEQSNHCNLGYSL